MLDFFCNCDGCVCCLIVHGRKLSKNMKRREENYGAQRRWVVIGPSSIFPWSNANANAKLLQSCPTLCDPIDGSPPGSTVPGILQARILEWVAISFSNAWKRKVKVKSLSCVRLLVTPWTAAYQVPPSMDFPGKSTGVGCHCLLQRKHWVTAFFLSHEYRKKWFPLWSVTS